MRFPQVLNTQLPDWARLSHPVLRTVLQREARRRTTASRALALLIGAGLVLMLLYGGVQSYQRGTSLGVSSQGETALFTVLYWLLLFLQLFVQTAALLLASNLFSSERQRGAWELVKITSHGAAMSVWARWAAVFYQMRWLVLLLIVPRLLFAGQMLADLTEYQGRHLDLYLMGITPDVSVLAGIALLAAAMAAALLQPLLAIGLNAAVGLLLAVAVENRHLMGILRLVVLIAEVVLFGVALSTGWIVLDADAQSLAYTSLSMGERWNGLLLMALGGDQSLRFMNVQTLFQAWADVDYGVLLGGVLLAAVIVEALVMHGLLGWAARRAARPARG